MSTEQGVLNAQYNAAEAAFQVACEQIRPFMLLRPRMFLDGNQWCALYGESIQEGVAAFGESPELAAKAFDAAWKGQS